MEMADLNHQIRGGLLIARRCEQSLDGSRRRPQPRQCGPCSLPTVPRPKPTNAPRAHCRALGAALRRVERFDARLRDSDAGGEMTVFTLGPNENKDGPFAEVHARHVTPGGRSSRWMTGATGSISTPYTAFQLDRQLRAISRLERSGFLRSLRTCRPRSADARNHPSLPRCPAPALSAVHQRYCAVKIGKQISDGDTAARKCNSVIFAAFHGAFREPRCFEGF